ncbi:BID domain-containing T4SS effector [Bartonella pachyuromydis]|uniref:protein adenylyltransferase n=1 Tax=Bartonella pachyuromydis TaxID=931097 RepID=A0ABP8VL58_9HYPH
MPKAKAKTKNISSPLPHHYLYSGTNILKNKYGETDLQLFREKSSYDIEQATKNLREEPLPEYFDLTYLCHIHHQLFKNTFEWAGKLRYAPFTFADESTAAMPEMKRGEGGRVFARDEEILESLQSFDQQLTEKNNLQGLTREDFIYEAMGLFSTLKQIHPFIDGNEHTALLFLEKLARAAGHQLDFSLTTRERIMFANISEAERGDLEPMQHLFEDISNPEKTLLLKEFMDNMKATGRNVNDHLVIVTKEGESYTGIYKGTGFNHFLLEAHGTYIIGNKDDLCPEQLKTLQLGDKFIFTAPNRKDFEHILIPKETLAPLTTHEQTERVRESARVHTARTQVQLLSQIVYRRSQALDKQMAEILQNPSLAQQLVDQIQQSPSSISPLAGFSICGLQNQTRVNARNHLAMLSDAVMNYAYAVEYTQYSINKDYQLEQKRCEKKVEKPSQNLQDLFCLSPQAQRDILFQNPMLCQELRDFVCQLESRLSAYEYRAIKHKDHETLAQSIGVSKQKAQEITETVQKAKEAHQQQIHTRKLNHSNALAMAS